MSKRNILMGIGAIILLFIVIGAFTSPSAQSATTAVATPTPQIVTKTETVEVEVVPQTCKDAINELNKNALVAYSLVTDTIDAYQSAGDLIDFGHAYEKIIMNFNPDSINQGAVSALTIACELDK